MNRKDTRKAIRAGRRHGRGWTRATHPHDGRETGGHPQGRQPRLTSPPARDLDNIVEFPQQRSWWRRVFRRAA